MKRTKINKKVIACLTIMMINVILFGSVAHAGISHKGWVEGRIWNRQAVGETSRWSEGSNRCYTRAQLIVNGGIIKRDSNRVYGYGYSKAKSGWGTGSAKTYYGRV